MNTLTKFIDIQMSLSSKETLESSVQSIDNAQVPKSTLQRTSSEQYQVIENEGFVKDRFKALSLSGSLFSLTSFTDVIFDSCSFYASKMENCTFINVKFENCTFEFTQLQHCSFNHCTFENCSFQISTISKSSFAFCTYETIITHLIEKGHCNKEYDCTTPEVLTWEEVLSNERLDNNAAKIDSTLSQNQKTASLKVTLIDMIDDAFSKTKAA